MISSQANAQDGLDSTLLEPDKILSQARRELIIIIIIIMMMMMMEPDKISFQARHELKCGCYERGLYYAEQGIMALIDLEDMYNPKYGKK